MKSSKIYWHLVITAIWIIFILCLWFGSSFTHPTDLNSLGDFLAGAFAPLAFFWLVAGFYQQGKGLEQNSEALKIQAKELEKSTEALELQVQEMKLALTQQTELTETTKQDLDLSKRIFEYQSKIQHTDAQPFFHLQRVHAFQDDKIDPEITLGCEILNSRSTCREVELIIKDITDSSRQGELKISPNYDLIDSKATYFVPTQILNQTMKFDDKGRLILEFNFSYLDATDSKQTSKLQLIIFFSETSAILKTLVQRPRTQYINLN